MLTLPVPMPDKDNKLTSVFLWTLFCGASKGFMKALKAIPQRIENKNLS